MWAPMAIIEIHCFTERYIKMHQRTEGRQSRDSSRFVPQKSSTRTFRFQKNVRIERVCRQEELCFLSIFGREYRLTACSLPRRTDLNNIYALLTASDERDDYICANAAITRHRIPFKDPLCDSHQANIALVATP